MMSEKLSADITESAIKLGVVDYVIKPIVKSLLVKSVENALKAVERDHAADEILGEITTTTRYGDIFSEIELTSASQFVGCDRIQNDLLRGLVAIRSRPLRNDWEENGPAGE